jgi:hypothetical protein
MKKLFKITATLEDDSYFDANAVVDVPAHLKAFDTYSDNQKDYFVQDAGKRIVTGVMISADTEIYRNDKKNGEHFVYFPAETIEILRNKFFLKGLNNRVNEMHDPNRFVDGMTLVETYIIDSKNKFAPICPPAFASQRLKDGTLIGSYYVTDDEILEKCKNGTYNGFSIEGYLLKEEVKQNTQMKKNKTNKFLAFLGIESEDKVSFISATTADGTVVNYEGELADGTLVTLEDGTPAPEGEHQLTLEDASVVVINLDDEGLVTSIEAVEAETEEDMTAEIAEAMKAMSKATVETLTEMMEAKFTALEKSFNDKFSAIEKGEKFNHTGKKVNNTTKNWKSVVK